MRFEREVGPYAEYVAVGELELGKTYFSVRFIDDEMLTPGLEPVVFIGRNLEPGDSDVLYFQDFESYRAGARYGQQNEGEPGRFECFPDGSRPDVCEFDAALDILLRCSAKRRQVGGGS